MSASSLSIDYKLIFRNFNIFGTKVALSVSQYFQKIGRNVNATYLRLFSGNGYFQSNIFRNRQRNNYFEIGNNGNGDSNENTENENNENEIDGNYDENYRNENSDNNNDDNDSNDDNATTTIRVNQNQNQNIITKINKIIYLFFNICISSSSIISKKIKETLLLFLLSCKNSSERVRKVFIYLLNIRLARVASV